MTKAEKVSATMQKKFGKENFFLLGTKEKTECEVISTGSLAIDIAIGVGGFPQGRIVEVYGPESSGKTTLTIHAIANAQKKGLLAAFIDAEHAFDPQYAENLGVDLDNLLFSQPSSGENALEEVEALLDTKEVGLIVIDSVAALTPQAEINGEMGDSKMGLHARLMSQACRKLTGKISKSNTCVIFINQIRMKIGVMFGNPETTTGGNALKFYASLRLDVRRKGKSNTDKEGNAISNPIKVKVIKNKLAPPFQVAETEIEFGLGINKYAEIRDLGIALDLIEKKGAWFAYEGQNVAHGKQAMTEYLEDNPEFAQVIEDQIREAYLDN